MKPVTSTATIHSFSSVRFRMDDGHVLEQFREAIRAAGIEPPKDINADGKLHRFSTNGQGSDDAGWYVFHLGGDVPAGAFGCWRNGISETWCAASNATMTAEQRAEYARRCREMKQQRDEARQKIRNEAAEEAERLWAAATDVPDGFSYLVEKKVNAYGIKCDGRRLLVPVRDKDRKLRSLQFIYGSGKKLSLGGGQIGGNYCAIGGTPRNTLYLAEGYATAATVHEAAGAPAVVTFGKGNFLAVAKIMREKFPDIEIVICADDDGGSSVAEAGEAAAQVDGKVAVPDFGENRPEKAKDFNDIVSRANLDLDHVRECLNRAAAPKMEGRPESAPSVEQPWPAMDAAAYHGLAGDVVRTIAPHTEADPVAILIQLLTYFGNVIGNAAYYQHEADRHHTNLFSTLVGASSRGRKGISAGRALSVIKEVDLIWVSGRMKGGLSSGEGVINEVRDEIRKWNIKDQVEEITDPGVKDKRLMVTEPEFARVLSVADRPGNIVTQIIRQAYDGIKLSTMVKNSPLTATDPHISIAGHITVEELRARLTRTDAANGFANRFMFFLVRRSKLLPHGGNLEDTAPELQSLRERVKQAAEYAKSVGRMKKTEAAKVAWEAVYPALTTEHHGLLGAVTARGEAQVTRLAMIYALLDLATEIDEVHLKAALAVWGYAEASAAYVFGDVLGDPIADEILRALIMAGKGGMTRNAIRDLFGRHQSANRIGAALALLMTSGRARSQNKETPGRYAEVWFAVL